MPYDAFNGSLVEQCICSDAGIQEVLELKRRITNSASIVSVLHLPDVSGMPTGRVRYGQGRKEKCLCSSHAGRVRYGRNQSTNWDAIEV